MTATPPELDHYITRDTLRALITQARAEDMGPEPLDITSTCCIAQNAVGRASLVAREAGTLCGAALLPSIVHVYNPLLALQIRISDGSVLERGDEIVRIEGSLRSALALERVALNLLGHLSGIATLTARYVAAAEGTSVEVLDTRKTLPGLRAIEKYAVACGGGVAHRWGLYDAMLVKDNHLAHWPGEDWPNAVADTIRRARRKQPQLKFVEVEVDTFEQLKAVLPLEVDIILLDNMTPHQLGQAVALRDQHAPHVQLEASGGITVDKAVAIAQSGIDRMAIGALTHSPPALDIAMDMDRPATAGESG